MIHMMYFKEPATRGFMEVIKLHDIVMCYCIFIISIVAWMTFVCIYAFGLRSEILGSVMDPRVRDRLIPRNYTRQVTLELAWTIIPICILCLIGWPSFVLLYKLDEPITHDVI